MLQKETSQIVFLVGTKVEVILYMNLKSSQGKVDFLTGRKNPTPIISLSIKNNRVLYFTNFALLDNITLDEHKLSLHAIHIELLPQI